MRFARAWADEYELTPARFDMLTAIANDPAGIAQNVLRRVLDVTSPVISRMLQSLEELGFVDRVVYPEDRRTNWITLTAEGKDLLDAAQREFLYGGFTERQVRLILMPTVTDGGVIRRTMKRTRRFLTKLRERVLDESTLKYPAYMSSGDRSPAHPLRSRAHLFPVTARTPPLLRVRVGP